MKMSEYIQILERELHILTKMLEIVTLKHEATVKMDGNKVQELVAKEERQLLAIQNIENERLNFQRLKLANINHDLNDTKIMSFIKLLKNEFTQEELKSIIVLQDKIKKLIKEIKKINENNLYITNYSINFVKQTIDSIIGGKNKSILDKKV
ncbi:MAG TPA: flagellar export chaperone FlgN [Ignavibacteriales bacterium]|nr:flagellar export chaperone FlgN [Ignavibacteriales bacterium]